MEDKISLIVFFLALAIGGGAVFWIGERWTKKNRERDAAILSSEQDRAGGGGPAGAHIIHPRDDEAYYRNACASAPTKGDPA